MSDASWDAMPVSIVLKYNSNQMLTFRYHLATSNECAYITYIRYVITGKMYFEAPGQPQIMI